MITVVNKHWHKPTEDDVYCGRGSPFGNPYSHLPSKFADVIKVGTREESIKRYEAWYAERTALNPTKSDSGYTLSVRDVDGISMAHFLLVRRVLDGKNTNLVCFCAPHACHCDVIKRRVEEDAQKIRQMT